MVRRSKLIYVIGSITLGIIAILGVFVSLVAAGIIGVTQSKLVFASASAEFVYDGTAHKQEEWSLVSGELKVGHTASINITGAQTDVGTSTNYMVVTILDESNVDVTDYYTIECQLGTLSVVCNSIHIASEDRSKVYDGTPLVGGGYSLVSGKVPEGSKLDVQFLGTITNVGVTENSFSVKITDANGADKTAAYSIETTFGKLEINARPIKLQSASASKEYDGTALTIANCSLVEGALVTGDKIVAHYGDGRIDVGQGESTFIVSLVNSAETDVSANYHISYLYGALTVTPRPISIKTASAEREYDGTPLITTENAYELVSGSIVHNQTLSVAVHGSQDVVGESENEATATVTDSAQNDVSHNYVVTYEFGKLNVTPRKLEVLTDSKESVYDGTMSEAKGYTLTAGTLVEGQELSLNFTCQAIDAGTYNNTATAIVLWGEENISRNYEITVTEGTIAILKREVTITTGDAEKIYDATPLNCMTVDYEVENGAIENHQITVTANGSQTDAGEGDNTATIKVVDGKGQDVTKNYSVVGVWGTLTVLPRRLEAWSGDAEKTYDSTPLTEDTTGYDVPDGEIEGHRVHVVAYGMQIDAGMSNNNFVTHVVKTNGVDVSSNYEIIKTTGTLTVTHRKLTIQSGASLQVYDGNPLSNDQVDVYGEQLASQTVTATLSGSYLTDVGTIDNEIANVEVKDNLTGVDVTKNYSFKLSPGTLKVTERLVEVQSFSVEKPYDGTPLVADIRYTISGLSMGQALSGQSVKITASSQTNVGVSKATFSMEIFEGTGISQRNVTSNFEIVDISETVGVVRITPRTLILGSNSLQKNYDGTPLKAVASGGVLPYWFKDSTDLAQGEYVSVYTMNSITDVAESPAANTATVFVINKANGTDSTGNYTIYQGDVGTLTINPRLLTIKTESAEKDYDGAPLIAGGYSFDENDLVDSHTLNVIVTGSRTEAGEEDNTCIVTVYDTVSVDVTGNYRIEKDHGSLVVKGTGGSGGGGSGGGGSGEGGSGEGGSGEGGSGEGGSGEGGSGEGGSGEGGSGEGGSGEGGSGEGGSGEGGSGEGGSGIGAPSLGDLTENPSSDQVLVEVTSSKTKSVYLRNEILGDYTGTGWEAAPKYSSLINGTHSANYLTSYALEDNGVSSHNVKVNVLFNNEYYLEPYYSSTTNSVIQISDNALSGDTTDEYTLTCYDYDYLRDGVIVRTRYSAEEEAYRTFVEANYLNVPESTADYLSQFIRENGLSADNIWQVVMTVKYAASYSMKYGNTLIHGKTLDDCEDIVVSFLRDYKVGVCRHYASAATLIFRMLGIPARTVGGFQANCIENTKTSLKLGHAWTEIYINGLGWVQLEVTGSSDEEEIPVVGNLNIRPQPIYVNYESTNKTAHTYSTESALVIGANDLPDGYTYQCAIETRDAIDVGIASTYITSFKLLYYGEVVYLYENGIEMGNVAHITCGEGIYQVYKYTVTLETGDYAHEYTGGEIKHNEYSLGALADGHHATVQCTGSITNVGLAQNTATITIYDSLNKDVTSHYMITRSYGWIEVTKKALTITADSIILSIEEWDGEVLTCSTYTCVGLIDEHELQVTIEGELDTLGSCENKITKCKIVDSVGNDVTNNYALTVVHGKLEIYLV